MMKKQVLSSLMLAVVMIPAVAQAEDASPFSANVSVTTDYIFRGISQTAHNPALQGGVDYANANGLYAGLWASNVSWIADGGAVASGSVSTEVDTYFGFRNALQNEFNYDVGFIRYNYLGSYTPAVPLVKADTDEVYLSAGYKWVSAKYSYGLGNFLTVPGAQGTNYLEINANVPLGDGGHTLILHAGKQSYMGSVAAGYANTPTYSDYKLGLAKEYAGFVFNVAYSKTNASPFYTFAAAGGNWGKGVATLTVTRSF